ncbi:MAG: glycosyltransferase [Candidatus Omnitrophota bacterium]|jgi:glycosyltransferase involved in cell wall biosynthesis
MRILFILSSIPVGGLEVFTVNLAEELIKTGHDPHILVFKSPDEALNFLVTGRIKVFSAGRNGKFNFSFLGNVHKYIKDLKPDVIVSLSSFAYFFVEFLQKLSGWHAPHIIAFHSLKPYDFKDKFLSKLFLFVSKLWKAYYLFVSRNQFIVNSKCYNLSERNSFIIHNAVDTEFFAPTGKKNDNGSLNIIHIGNIVPEKDQWTLINSLEILDKSFTDWKLVFLGRDKINLLEI